MSVTITARHTDITDAMRDYAAKQAERLTEHFDILSDVEVTLNVEKNRHTAEIIAICRKGSKTVASATSRDMYATLDQVGDKMFRQMRRRKEKIKDHRTRKPELEPAPADEEG